MTIEHEHDDHGGHGGHDDDHEHQVQPLLTVADFNGDGAVNWSDLNNLFSH